MSMILILRRLPQADENYLRRKPGKILDYLDQQDVWEQDESLGNRELDLDKAWHGLHYLFTQTNWEGETPANYLIKGGKLVDEKARFSQLTSDQSGIKSLISIYLTSRMEHCTTWV